MSPQKLLLPKAGIIAATNLDVAKLDVLAGASDEWDPHPTVPWSLVQTLHSLFSPMPSTARTDVVLPMMDDYMQQIVRGEKNYEFRKYRIASTVSTVLPGPQMYS